MLKAKILTLYIVILLMMENQLPVIVANGLAFIAGLCLQTLPEVIRRTISWTDFFVRLVQISGLVILVLLIADYKKIDEGQFVAIFIVTLFSDIIVKLGMRYGSKWLEKKAKKLDNNE